LPLGRDKRFLNGNRIVNRYVIGGWSISGIQNYRAGAPLAITTNGRLSASSDLDGTTYNNVNLRPNTVVGVNPRTGLTCGNIDPATGLYLNSAAFVDPRPFTFGNAARRLSYARGCGGSNENVSLMKYQPFLAVVYKIADGFRGKLWLLSCLREGGVYDLRRRRGVALQVEQRKQSAL
jgi:hypothetical protein